MTCSKEVGYWKRNFLVYLAELLKKKKQVGSASSLGIFIIELFDFPNKSWVYDTSCGTHICITKQGFREAKKMKQRSLYLYVGNGVRAQVEAIGSFDLALPNGLVICLDNCHYAPSITRENQLGKTIKALRSNRGGEYISQEFKDYLKAFGIVQQLTPPYTPQHNGVSERKNRYPKKTMGYYFYFLPENKIVVVRYAEFFEKNLITQEVNGRAIDLEEIQDEDTPPSEITSKIPMEVKGFEQAQEEVIPIYRSERAHRAPNHLCLNVEVEDHSLWDLNEPASYKTTMLDSESNKWIDAMNAEIQSMIDNMVWVLVDLSPGCKTVGSKWIFKKKTKMDGIAHTCKARLVEKGYTQLYGVDYEETFSPVADIRAIRILISIAAYYDYDIWQMDVKTAFLNGYLDEDIYMVQPEGFIDPNHPRKVCKL
nr:retrotransposon protein, putative, Ty1-copia subclass [Tanacetum cinerariifolium]